MTDDPAAARGNPARLGAIPSPSALVEARFGMCNATRFEETEPLNPALNPVARIEVASEVSTDTPTTVGFMGYAHPLTVMGRPFVVAASVTRSLEFSSHAASTTRTTPLAALPTPGAGDEVVRIGASDLEMTLDLWSLAAGWRLTPTFSVGGTIEIGRLDVDSRSAGLLSDPLNFTGPGTSDPTFGTATPELLIETRSTGSDTAVGYAFGAWWKPIPSLGLGSVYRSGSRFELEGVAIDRAAMTETRFDDPFRTPDAAGVGLAWAPFHRSGIGMARTLVLALDLERVEYSDLEEGFSTGRGIQTSGLFGGAARFEAEDAVEVRAGVEATRSFPGWSLTLRGGLYTEHDPRPALTDLSGDTAALAGQSEALERSGFLARDDMEPHLTFGLGARFYAFSFDVAVDLSDPETRVIASGSWRLR